MILSGIYWRADELFKALLKELRTHGWTVMTMPNGEPPVLQQRFREADDATAVHWQKQWKDQTSVPAVHDTEKTRLVRMCEPAKVNISGAGCDHML